MCFGFKLTPSKLTIYYLLYKLYTSNLIWIIKLSDDYSLLENNIKNLSINEKMTGKYFIIERYENEEILYKNFKQFQLYELKLYDYVLFESN